VVVVVVVLVVVLVVDVVVVVVVVVVAVVVVVGGGGGAGGGGGGGVGVVLLILIAAAGVVVVVVVVVVVAVAVAVVFAWLTSSGASQRLCKGSGLRLQNLSWVWVVGRCGRDVSPAPSVARARGVPRLPALPHCTHQGASSAGACEPVGSLRHFLQSGLSHCTHDSSISSTGATDRSGASPAIAFFCAGSTTCFEVVLWE